MTELRRLCDFSASPRARELLRAGIADGPRPAALRRTALALGVGASVTVTASAGAAAATSAAAPASLATIAAKWIAIGTLGGFALAGGASAVSSLAEPAAAPRDTIAEARRAAKAAPAPLLAVPALGLPAASAAAAPEALLSSGHAPRALSAAAARTASSAPPASAMLPERSGVAAHVAKIDAARSALGRGDARAALQQLDEYAALDRTGTLDREAQLLRIDALQNVGERAHAMALAARYLRQFPGDPHAARLHALLGDRSRSDATSSEER